MCLCSLNDLIEEVPRPRGDKPIKCKEIIEYVSREDNNELKALSMDDGNEDDEENGGEEEDADGGSCRGVPAGTPSQQPQWPSPPAHPRQQ